MTNEVDVQRDSMAKFKEDLSSKLRENIRDLLPEDVIADLVQTAIKEEFFTGEKIRRGLYSDEFETRPSWFVQQVTQEATPIVNEYVKQFIADRSDLIEQAIDSFLTENVLILKVTDVLTQKLTDAVDFLVSNQYSNN